jgi:D-alanyl-D-alanine dipeptidase
MLNSVLLDVYARKVQFKTLFSYKYGSWRNLPIQENNEPLILVPQEICYPFYAKSMNLVEDDRLFLRERVLSMAFHARNIVQTEGFDLKVYDGWRSVSLQENLFWFYLKEFTVGKFDLQQNFQCAKTAEEIKTIFLSLTPTLQTTLKEANRVYVSWPSINHNSPSPHATGGSIDVWLYQNNQPADLGIPFDWMEDNAGAFYHLKWFRSRYSGSERTISKNRNLLIYAMTKAGFSCYGPEIWHYNYGNQMDSLVSGKVACYSYVEPKEMV